MANNDRIRKQNILASLAQARKRGDAIFVACAFCGNDLRTCACADAKEHDESMAARITDPQVRTCAERLIARKYS